jgi:eukaryotic-like serine/threonine-protein kinase
MELCAEELIPLLVQSRLFDEASAAAALENWRAVAGSGADDAAIWRRWLVEQKLITEYQSTLLERGHAVGYFLRDYKILDRIGRGRMAGVYRACDDAGQLVAIKVLPPSKAKDLVLLARFRREARFVGRLSHTNVVRAFQVDEVDGFNYLVMEFLQGETLDAVLHRRGRLSVVEAIDLLEQALSGLQHIHEKGLVHRDPKPGNMMLVHDPNKTEAHGSGASMLKILDFGLSRAVDEDPGPEPIHDVQLTAAGAMVGTPDYVAPEQACDARSADIRADIYSLGCMAYHMLTGQPPFPDKNALRQMVRHATEAPVPLAQLCPDAPAYLHRVLDRMLAKSPAGRFETPAQALQALRAASRETETFMAAPSLDGSSELTKPMKVVAEPPSVEFDFAGAEAPAVKQAVFSPLPAGATTKTLTSSNTPPDVPPPGKQEERLVARAPAKISRDKPKPVTTARSNTIPMPGPGVLPITPGSESDPSAATSGFRWTHRDTLIFAAGAATVLFALGLGAVLSWLLRTN